MKRNWRMEYLKIKNIHHNIAICIIHSMEMVLNLMEYKFKILNFLTFRIEDESFIFYIYKKLFILFITYWSDIIIKNNFLY